MCLSPGCAVCSSGNDELIGHVQSLPTDFEMDDLKSSTARADVTSTGKRTAGSSIKFPHLNM